MYFNQRKIVVVIHDIDLIPKTSATLFKIIAYQIKNSILYQLPCISVNNCDMMFLLVV